MSEQEIKNLNKSFAEQKDFETRRIEKEVVNEILDEVLRDKNVRHLQVLTHDAMWSNEVLSPRQRVRTSIQANAERVKERYDQILIDFGAKNIDD